MKYELTEFALYEQVKCFDFISVGDEYFFFINVIDYYELKRITSKNQQQIPSR